MTKLGEYDMLGEGFGIWVVGTLEVEKMEVIKMEGRQGLKRLEIEEAKRV